MRRREKFTIHTTVRPHDPLRAVDFLAERVELSKICIKDAMVKGAVWLKRKGKRAERLRRASTPLKPGDSLEFYYDAFLLAITPPTARCVSDQHRYSVWEKPAGVLTQGTRYSDHCSLLRQVETSFSPRRDVFPVHRLDREAWGLVCVAHTKNAAANLSHLFREHLAVKRYHIEVMGNLASYGNHGSITRPLDGKEALTEYTVESYSPEMNTTTVHVVIKTGRYHQIRRHFATIGFPVMGDPRYGRGNKNTEGMKIAAVRLEFRCPFSGREMVFSLEEIVESSV